VGQLYNTYERERCRRVLNTSVLTGIPLSTASTHASKKKRAEGERGGEQSQVKALHQKRGEVLVGDAGRRPDD